MIRAVRGSAPATRVGFALHAAMTTAMVLMLIPGPRWAAVPQMLFFGLAGWWFILRAVSRRPVTLAGPGRGRLPGGAGVGSLLYSALTMTAMAYMLAAMDVRGPHGALTAPDATGVPGSAGHHGGAVPDSLPDSLPASVPVSVPKWSSLPAAVLAVVFAAAGALWAFLLLRRLHAGVAGSDGGSGTGEAFLELVGAAAMAVMFAALASKSPGYSIRWTDESYTIGHAL